MNKVFIYYLERNNIPFYVGKCKNIVRRKHVHYRTYGNNINIIILDEVGEEKNEWKFWECYYISLFKTWGFQLTNKNEGGGGPSFYSDESKQKMRKPRREGTGKKISKTLLKNNHSDYYTKEVRIKISKGKNPRDIIQSSLEGNFIKEWESIGEISRFIKSLNKYSDKNINTQIRDNCIGRQKTAFGYKWSYKI